MKRPLRSVDFAAHTEVIYIASICGGVGLVFGGFLGFLLFRDPVRGVVVLGIPMGLASSALAYSIVERAGHAAGGLHTPSGQSTPRRYQLSREEALVVSGRYEDAAVSLMDVCEEHPDDARPRIMLAELYRDHLDDLEQTVLWYRRAATVPGLTLDGQRQILRALVELCRDRMGRPELAAPALSRAAQVHAGNRLGYWAKQELEAMRVTGPAREPPGTP